jgi:lipoprotein-anchoring transpeptidase ErfK/SrfK
MAKIGYTYDAGRSTIRSSRKNNGGGFKRVVFILLLIAICVGAYFLIFKNNNKAQSGNTPQVTKEQNLTLSELPPAQAAPQPVTKTEVPVVKPLPVETPPAPAPTTTAAPQLSKYELAMQKACEIAEKAYEAGEYVKARQLAEKVIKSPDIKENSAIWNQAAEILSKANTKIIFTDIPMRDKKVSYEVKKGDSLEPIAKKFNTTIELIQVSNNMKKTNYNVWVGQSLKMYPGKWNIRISKDKFILYLYDGDELFKIYHIGTGRQDRTPEGSFQIVAKQKNPAWNKSRSEVIPFGDKENVLGTRWMALRPTGDTNKNLHGYGIHGTWAPESIGKNLSNGCIRMKNSDVEELFAIVPYNTEVIIEK